MSIRFTCQECGTKLRAKSVFTDGRAKCPACGHTIVIPSEEPLTSPSAGQESATSAPTEDTAGIGVVEFLDPPTARPENSTEPEVSAARRMFEALLDPRSIQWILTLGGALAVLGLIIWLVSLGIFKDPAVLAIAMGIGTLAILGLGWFIALKTRYGMAGNALTFLGCVIAPLNLWFYHSQDLMTIDNHLWIGAVVCCLLYAATVVVLRQPLFIYAVECGITLTALLLLADIEKISDTAFLSLFLMVLGLISIHAERIFTSDSESHFNRDRYGVPLFWSGYLQAMASLLILVAIQVNHWFGNPIAKILNDSLNDNLVAWGTLLPCVLWIGGAYVYLYGDLVVHRLRRGIYSAAFCLVMAEVSVLLGYGLDIEWMIVVLALTALGANVMQSRLQANAETSESVDPAVPRLAFILNGLPILLGGMLHLRATSQFLDSEGWSYSTGWEFVVAMIAVAAVNRYSAWMFRYSSPRSASVCYMFYVGAVIVGAAGLLRVLGWAAWIHQAPLLMLIPIAYIGASRMWRGHSPERPLAWVAQAATAVILVHTLFASLTDLSSWQPIQSNISNLYLGLVFTEAAVFYALAGIFRRRSANVFAAAAAAIGAVWQLMGYWAVPETWQTVTYACLGLSSLVIGRTLGLERTEIFRPSGDKAMIVEGRGATAFQCGNAILVVALLSAFLRGLGQLTASGLEWSELTSPLLTMIAAVVAIGLVPAGLWRRVYLAGAISLAGLTVLTLNVLIDLSGWQKLEIFCVVSGVAMLVASHIGRFSEEHQENDSSVSMGLWIGSAMTTLPLLIAFIAHRFYGSGPSLSNEFALLTLTILMLVTGVSWQTKATTFFGGGTLVIYLIVLVVSIAYRPQVAVGVYLVVGGVIVFALGILLSVYRDRLLALPDEIAGRKGLFRVLDWR